MTTLKLYLRDINPDMVDAWKKHFQDEPNVEVSQGDIFNGTRADAIVSPANAFAYMDGGIDLAYSRHFGWDLSAHLREVLFQEYAGELLVGQATIIDIKPFKPDTNYRWLISAPTMRIPMDVSDTVNAYLAFRGTLLAVKKHNANWETWPEKYINSILCPGLGTAIGNMSPEVCAQQMSFAWGSYLRGWPKYQTLSQAMFRHYSLIETPEPQNLEIDVDE